LAKTANNKKGDSGKARQSGRSTQSKKSVAKRADGRSARGRAPPKPHPNPKSQRPAEKKGFTKFLRDVRVEMGKVTWPTRKDLAQSTLVVLVAVAIATAYTGLLDLVFEKVLNFVVNLLT
jgi:preprotein translocase subunit SecE